ncbi:MAG: hypothetical protein H0U13_05445 [Gemmatimonadaceae bacterium]|nr:hypothetical protein [Gemmatimonadaceae bacterium]
MARAPGDERGLRLSPRQRTIAGWVAAIALIIGVAVAFRVLGGNADGTAVGPSPTASDSRADPRVIAFGTALGADDAVGAETTDRFTAGDTFAYSVDGPSPLPVAVYVEVRRTGGGPAETVQAATEQLVPQERAPAIAFVVTAVNLIDDFGAGEYLMLLYLDADDVPYAEGAFELVVPPSASGDS